MILSDIAVTRPVVAAVFSLLLVAFGLVSYERLSLREYPDIDPPVVSVRTTYPGASAAVVESQITEKIEDRIAGIEGIRFIDSQSRDGRSDVRLEFSSGRDIDAAANDVRDRVSGVLNNLPTEADPPEVQKEDSDSDVIMWLNLTATNMDTKALTDYARRYLQDRFSTLPGVARVRVGGGLEYALRVWLDADALAARGLSLGDIEQALRGENLELPAGQLESRERMFTVRIARGYRAPQDFDRMIVGRGADGGLIRLGDVARVELGAAEDRTAFRGNTVPMVGLGVIKQSTANTLSVTRAARALAERLKPTLPPGMEIRQSYDTSVFISAAIAEVWKTLAVAVGLVVLVIYLFLGSVRAMLVPAVTVPVSLIATFMALLAMGFSVNLLTLLALVLAVGLVVDDSIVMLENIHRRVTTGETPLVAAFRGARQVAFAVVATSVVLAAVFVPISFLQGDLGRLFSEFALTMAGAVFFSTLVALTLSPMLASKLLRADQSRNARLTQALDRGLKRLADAYVRVLDGGLHHGGWMAAIFVGLLIGSYALFQHLPEEYAPAEDRGAFFVIINGPEGANFDYMSDYAVEIEDRLMPLVEAGEVKRLLMRVPRGFSVETFNGAIAIIVLEDWAVRRNAWEIIADVRQRLADLPGVQAFPIMRQGFGRGVARPVQFVLGGGEYSDLAQWAQTLKEAAEERMPGLADLQVDYEETQPQLEMRVDREQAAALGLTAEDIGLAVQALLGTRRITTFIDRGEEYDVIVSGVRAQANAPNDILQFQIRSPLSGALVPLGNVLSLRETAGANTLNRYNRVRAVTLTANVNDGHALRDELTKLTELAREVLPPEVVIDYKGQSRDLQEAQDSLQFIFLLGLLVVFLVLAAQFESWIQPFVIMLTVPLAISGALLGLWLSGSSLNIYSQIGLVMLVGLAAKNGILIVEFTNQLRDEGREFEPALLEAARIRFRPIVMTGITTAAGGLPLILSSGAGSETRFSLGVVIVSGVVAATLFTLFVVPVAYRALARNSTSPQAVAQRLVQESGEPESR